MKKRKVIKRKKVGVRDGFFLDYETAKKFYAYMSKNKIENKSKLICQALNDFLPK